MGKHSFARTLRKDSTDAERRLWFHLRSRRLLGMKFRRQHPLGKYIVDFACVEHRLVVELDGGQHVVRADRDAVRTAWLEAAGWRVLRFWDDEVLLDVDAVLEVVVATSPGTQSRAPHPDPSPAEWGEGADCRIRGRTHRPGGHR